MSGVLALGGVRSFAGFNSFAPLARLASSPSLTPIARQRVCACEQARVGLEGKGN